MVTVGQTSIKCDSHLDNAIRYITKEEKALSLKEMKEHLDKRLNHLSDINSSIGEKATYLNCSSQNTYKDFENMRKALVPRSRFRRPVGASPHNRRDRFRYPQY